MKTILKQMTLSCLVLSFAVGCSLFRKKTTTDESGLGAGGVKTETTADGGTEQIQSSAMSFSAQGSDSGSIEGLSTVFFEYDRAVLSGSEKAKLEANVAWLKRNSSVKMTIEGHCDQRGSNEYNLSLGERRANAVKQSMVQMGVAGDRLSTVSFGEEKPLVQGDSEQAMSKNRRANFVPAQ